MTKILLDLKPSNLIMYLTKLQGQCCLPFELNCSKGNSSREPYISLHKMLLAHASATNLYKKQSQVTSTVESRASSSSKKKKSRESSIKVWSLIQYPKKERVKLKRYSKWSVMDLYEMSGGYNMSYGLLGTSRILI